MASPRSISLEGVALHAGTPCLARLVRSEPSAPVTLVVGERAVPREALVVVRNDRGVMVRLGEEPGSPTVDLVEHLFAALGGLGITHGVQIEITGGEVPLLDGGAADFVRALIALEIPAGTAWPRVRHGFAWTEGDVAYAIEPAQRPSLEVTVDFAHPAIGRQTCEFSFDHEDFVTRIAPARTFGFARDWPALLAQGRARGVDRRSVCVFEEASSAASTPGRTIAVTDEPARHKLLDLLGDCTLLGGPFEGALRATRPGHRATQAFLAAARTAGVFG